MATQQRACMIGGKREFQGPLIDTALREPPLTYEYINKTKHLRDFALKMKSKIQLLSFTTVLIENCTRVKVWLLVVS